MPLRQFSLTELYWLIAKRLFEKSSMLLTWAIENRGYTDETHLSYGTLRERGFEILDFVLVPLTEDFACVVVINIVTAILITAIAQLWYFSINHF